MRVDLLAVQDPGWSPGVDASRIPPRVLVVDDDPSIRQLCQLNLELAGVEVLEAGDGKSALDRARAERPDLVLTDLAMPELDGWNFIAAITEDERTRGTPIIVLSGEIDPQTRARALELGVRDFVSKPFHPEALVARILELLRPPQQSGAFAEEG